MAVSTSPRGAGVTVRRDPAAPWRHIDVVLVVCTLALSGLGLLMVYSATRATRIEAGLDPYTFLEKQALFVALGALLMLAVTVIDYRVYRDFAPVLYVGAVIILLAVLSPLGSTSKGAQAWFQLGSFQLQPSEFAKLVVTVCVAAYASLHRGDLTASRLAVVLVMAGVLMGLIYLQPDLGSALVFVAVLMGMLLVAGA